MKAKQTKEEKREKHRVYMNQYIHDHPEQREAARVRAAAWYEQNKGKSLQEKARERKHRIRLEVIAAYGGKCAHCGENSPHRLHIHHKNGGGSHERGRHGRGVQFLYWLRRNGYPNDIELLCATCHADLHYPNRKLT